MGAGAGERGKVCVRSERTGMTSSSSSSGRLSWRCAKRDRGARPGISRMSGGIAHRRRPSRPPSDSPRASGPPARATRARAPLGLARAAASNCAERRPGIRRTNMHPSPPPLDSDTARSTAHDRIVAREHTRVHRDSHAPVMRTSASARRAGNLDRPSSHIRMLVAALVRFSRRLFVWPDVDVPANNTHYQSSPGTLHRVAAPPTCNGARCEGRLSSRA